MKKIQRTSSSSKCQAQKLAVVVIVWFGNKILLTKRRGTRFSGWWAAIGGQVENGESFVYAAQREAFEEVGITLSMGELDFVTNYRAGEFECLIFEAHWSEEDFKSIKRKEPTKHGPWKLFSISEALKLKKLMPSLRQILLTRKQGYV
jgi:8-oxo-dGTP pyrophosphatase MutT (NUDIX family)